MVNILVFVVQEAKWGYYVDTYITKRENKLPQSVYWGNSKV